MATKQLSTKQKEVITKLRSGYFLYENVVTPGARWCLVKSEQSYNWGNVNGNVIYKIMHLLKGERLHLGCFEYKLTELGNEIKLK